MFRSTLVTSLGHHIYAPLHEVWVPFQMVTYSQKTVADIKYMDLDFSSEQIVLSRKHYEKDENQQKQIIKFMLCWIRCHHF